MASKFQDEQITGPTLFRIIYNFSGSSMVRRSKFHCYILKLPHVRQCLVVCWLVCNVVLFSISSGQQLPVTPNQIRSCNSLLQSMKNGYLNFQIMYVDHTCMINITTTSIFLIHLNRYVLSSGYVYVLTYKHNYHLSWRRLTHILKASSTSNSYLYMSTNPPITTT